MQHAWGDKYTEYKMLALRYEEFLARFKFSFGDDIKTDLKQ